MFSTIVDEMGEIPDIPSTSYSEDPSSSVCDDTPQRGGASNQAGGNLLNNNGSNSIGVPHWALTPNLTNALQTQGQFDPDDIFGPLPPCSLEDIFKGSKDARKLRHRTSSGNWSGVDKLTTEEEEDYKLRMGFVKKGFN